MKKIKTLSLLVIICIYTIQMSIPVYAISYGITKEINSFMLGADEVSCGDFILTTQIGSSSSTWEYNDTQKLLEIYDSSTYSVKMNDGIESTSTRIIIANGANPTITLNNIQIKSNVSKFGCIQINGSATIILEGSNSLDNSQANFGIGLAVVESASLTLQGSGYLNAKGGNYVAGIGSNQITTVGEILIKGNARIFTEGGLNAAGLGGGYLGNSSKITITDMAKVIALGGSNAIAIGGGNLGTSGTLAIGKDAKVIGLSYKDECAFGGSNILVPSGESTKAEIIDIRLESPLESANSIIQLREGTSVYSEVSEENMQAQSISFSVPSGTTKYRLYIDNVMYGCGTDYAEVDFIASSSPYTNVAAYGHKHIWQYSVEGMTITARCLSDVLCDHGNEGGSVTLAGPTKLTYDGEEKSATLSGEFVDDMGISEPFITYGQINNGIETPMTSVPVNVGDYYAKVTMTDAESEKILQVDYTITQVPATGLLMIDLTDTNADNIVNESDILVANILYETPVGGVITYQWYKNNEVIAGAVSDHYLILAEDDIEGTEIYCEIIFSENTQGSLKSLPLMVGKTILTGEVTITAIENGSVLVGKAVGDNVEYVTEYTWQWYRNNGIIGNATVNPYEVVKDDLGQEMLVAIVAKNTSEYTGMVVSIPHLVPSTTILKPETEPETESTVPETSQPSTTVTPEIEEPEVEESEVVIKPSVSLESVDKVESMTIYVDTIQEANKARVNDYEAEFLVAIAMIEGEKSNLTVEIGHYSTNIDILEILMTKTMLESVLRENISTIEYKSENISLIFDLEAITDLASIVKEYLYITIEKVELAQLAEEWIYIIEDRPMYLIQVYLENGDQIVSLEQGVLNIGINYTLSAVELPKDLSIYYTDGKDMIILLENAKYSIDDQQFLFSTNRFAYYGVGLKEWIEVEVEEEVQEVLKDVVEDKEENIVIEQGEKSWITWIILSLVVVLCAVGIAVIFLNKQVKEG